MIRLVRITNTLLEGFGYNETRIRQQQIHGVRLREVTLRALEGTCGSLMQQPDLAMGKPRCIIT